jgi:cephalosporin hydroxylase
MDDEKDFKMQCESEINQQGQNLSLKQLTREWFNESVRAKYSYHFEWLGRPIIQYPQDIVGMQQLLWSVKPDLIIETGIARGGSLIFYASILELISQCGGPEDGKVLGIDIDIRSHNRDAILAHPMSKRIEMFEGSSINQSTVDHVTNRAKSAKKVMICLDSNHTHNHVLQELRLYAPLVSIDSYAIVLDTVVEDMPSNLIHDRPWGKGNNPKTAVFEYLKEIECKKLFDSKGTVLKFEIDKQIENQLMITVAPSGFLKRIS